MGIATRLLVEMANIKNSQSGLDNNIWIRPRSTEKHGPRLKVQIDHNDKINTDNFVSVTIGDKPKVIGSGLSKKDTKRVVEFILINKQKLLDIWNGTETPKTVIPKLTKAR